MRGRCSGEDCQLVCAERRPIGASVGCTDAIVTASGVAGSRLMTRSFCFINMFDFDCNFYSNAIPPLCRTKSPPTCSPVWKLRSPRICPCFYGFCCRRPLGTRLQSPSSFARCATSSNSVDLRLLMRLLLRLVPRPVLLECTIVVALAGTLTQGQR